MILVTGASGQLGHAVLTHLTSAGVKAFGGTRHPKPESTHLHIDFDDPTTLTFEGINTLLIVSAGTAEDDVVIARHERVIAAAERDGVGHLIYTSLTTAGDHLGFALAHRWTENRIRQSTIAWTILRNGLYAELIAELLRPTNDLIRAPFGSGSVAAVAREDLALAAAKVAAAPEHHVGRTYDLVGATAVTATQAAQQLGASYEPATLENLRASLASSGLQAFQPPMLVSIHSAIAGGFLGETSTQLETLIERPPRPALTVISDVLK